MEHRNTIFFKKEIQKNIENHQTKMAARNTRKRNNRDIEQSENKK